MSYIPRFIHILVFVVATFSYSVSATTKSGKCIVSKSHQELAEIKLQSIHFQNITLTECLNFLKSRATELDTTTLDPKLKGVSITHLTEPHINTPRITINAQNASFITVITQIAIKAEYDLYITSTGIVLSPPGTPPYPNQLSKKGDIWSTLYRHKKIAPSE